MKKNSYLYGHGVEVPEIPQEVIVRRLELLQENLDALLKLPPDLRDRTRIHYIHKAIHYWENINEEVVPNYV